LISWLLLLALLPYTQPTHAIEAFRNLIDNYEQRMHGDRHVSPENRHMIDCDVPRCIEWFRRLARMVGVDQEYYEHAGEDVFRIFELLASEADFSYYQGFDRFVFIPYLVCLQFAAQWGLPCAIAESLTFPMSERLLQIANLPYYVAEESFAAFGELDSCARYLRPDLYELLDRGKYTSFYFAHRWRLLWFADEHTAEGILRIWDSILTRYDKLDNFLTTLSFAHIAQIKLTDETRVLEEIQNFRDWRPREAIRHAISFGNIGPQTWTERIKRNFPVCLFIVLFVWLLMPRGALT
jgi:hypothetical protein